MFPWQPNIPLLKLLFVQIMKISVIHYWDPSRKGGGGLVLCAMYKIHLLAMCYVSFCSHCYVKIKWGAMQKYNLCYVLCK